LTLNALVSGANQKTSRSPVIEATESEVQAALDSLKSANLVMETSGGRVSRYSHNVERVLQVPSQSIAILTSLMLRGPQTAGELRINCERLHSFADISAVEGFLNELAARPAGPLVVQLARLPGSRENRWAHLLSGAPKLEAVEKEVPLGEAPGLKADVARLESELAALKELVGRIAKQLGISCLLLALLWLANPTGALAQTDYPNRPLRLMVTVPPGGAADFIARLVGGKLAESLGQPVLVENRAGASGTIAADAVAKAAPDGYTLLQNSITTHGVGPHLFAKLPYDPVSDFAPVSGLALLPLIMAVNAELPARDVNQLVAYAKAHSVNFASSGSGGAPHMAAELFKSVTGAPIVHVPYKGSGPAVADLIGGRVQLMFDAAPSLIQHVRSGKLRVLAAASTERNRLLPEVPTFAELGHPQVSVSLWYGLLAPAGTPRPVVEKLNREVGRVLDAADVKDRLQAQGAEPMRGTPEAFAAFMREEMAKWAPVVNQAGVKAE
ncbi:MAG TPA: tripartite tricarboxylate transporter substrate-binding protein, partial [Burkholderiales bacterium]